MAAEAMARWWKRCNGASGGECVGGGAGGSGRLETRGLAQKAYAARGGEGGRVEKGWQGLTCRRRAEAR